MRRLAEMTWPEVAGLPRERSVFLLPVGATEAHGPHLPLGTDDLIAEAMAAEGASLLEARGLETVLAPTLSLTPAPFASELPGTLSLAAEAAPLQVESVGRSLAAAGFRHLAIVNAHFDPANVGALRRAVATLGAETALAVAFPDLTRRSLAARLTEEFRSGACHAGRYEGSIVLAVRPDLFREEVARGLPPHPVSLVTAMAEGRKTFREAGGDRAYFGDPAAASAEEGREILRILGQILAEAVLANLDPTQ